MEENIVMENEVCEDLVPVENEVTEDDVSSGNSFNKGTAALVAGGVIGAVLLGRTVIKRIKAKKAAKAGEETDAEKAPKPKEKKGLKLGKNKKVVIIDMRDEAQKKEEPAEEVENEE